MTDNDNEDGKQSLLSDSDTTESAEASEHSSVSKTQQQQQSANGSGRTDGDGVVTVHVHPESPRGGIRWKRIIATLWAVVVVVMLLGCLPWGIVTMYREHYATHVKAWFVAGIFVCLAVPITIWDIAQHLNHWFHPTLQKHVIRVIWMVPIYALNSWFALRFVGAGIYLDTMREMYEAYVIYNFYVYLLVFLREQEGFDLAITKREPQPHIFPFCWLKPWRMGQTFIDKCTHGVTSYIIVRPICTLLALLTEALGKYGDGEIRADKSWIYLASIASVSQTWALYCLILFYMAFKKDLAPIKPLYKFLTIKAVVFLSFWQSILIAILAATGVIKDDPTWTTYNEASVASGLQDFLICIEMFFAAVVHHWVFSYREFFPKERVERERLTMMQSLRQLFDVSDVRATVVDHVRVIAPFGNRDVNQQSALTPLLKDAKQPSYSQNVGSNV